MKTSIFAQITQPAALYEYWKGLTVSEQVTFLFEQYEAAMYAQDSLNVDLSEYFQSVANELEQMESESQISYDFEDDSEGDRVDVMIDDVHILIESNNLKAVRFVTYKFVESGYILQRDLPVEKMFRKDKVTRYLRVFKIINQATDICTN
jgi:hypothetical protein